MTPALHHYPRRFRWEDERPDEKGHNRAILRIGGRLIGGLIRYRGAGPWCAYGADFMALDVECYGRRCDAKRAGEGAVVRGAK